MQAPLRYRSALRRQSMLGLRYRSTLGLPYRSTLPLALAALVSFPSAIPLALADESPPPVASAFVYPVGDELDCTKPAASEAAGYYISDRYLAVRKSRRRKVPRVHYGVDLSNGRSGSAVRSIAAGVVEVSDANALVKVRKAQKIKLPTIVDGKRTYRWGTRYRTSYKWRTGWGNRVVIRHTLPNGEVVYSLYAHLAPRSVLVKKGEIVGAGQPIARVGRTGRATAAHLHLEIRQTRIDEDTEISDPDGEFDPREEQAETVVPHTVDPIAFLESRVVRFEDLEPGTWQSRYVLAAIKDGVMTGSKARFEPDATISRESFYGALVSVFQLGTPFTKDDFDSKLDALVDSGIVDSRTRSRERAGDHISRSQALELVLRCLDRRAASGRSLARIAAEHLSRDFNREFAGPEAAAAAEKEARSIALAETAKLKKEAAARAARAAKAARAQGKRVRHAAPKVPPVKVKPLLDPGFGSLAQSAKSLSRAQACLLLASTLRLAPSQLSALERAAARVANSG